MKEDERADSTGSLIPSLLSFPFANSTNRTTLFARMKPTVGLYEQVVNEVVGEAILEARKHGLDIVLRNLDSGDSHSYLAQYLTNGF